MRSFWRLTAVDPGFDSHNVLLADIWLPVTTIANPPYQTAFFHDILERVRALPGVTAAAATTHYPVSIFNELSNGLLVSGRPELDFDKSCSVAYISPDYFRAMGIRLIEGRPFTDHDTSQARKVAMISQTVARGAFEGRDPIGQEISFDGPNGPWRTVVGVVADTKNYTLDREPWPEIFIPYTQVPSFFMTIVLRTNVDPLRLAAALQKAVQSIDRNQAVSNIQAMDEIMEASVAPRRFKAILLGIFAVLAIILAAVGVYGVGAQSVVERTHEIGIRTALGAERADVLKLVVSEGILLILIGVGIGTVAAMALTRFLSSLLYGVRPTDPATFVAVSLLLWGVGLLAIYIPAHQATKLDPLAALRYE